MYEELIKLAEELDQLKLYGYSNKVDVITKISLMGPSNVQIKKLKDESDMSASDALHLVLDLIGIVPGYGEVADITNAALYLSEGLTDENIFKAAISVTSMISGLGDVAKVLKYMGKSVPPSYFKSIANLITQHIDLVQATFTRLKDSKVTKYLKENLTDGELISQNADRMFLSIKRWAKSIIDSIAKRETTKETARQD